MGERGTSDCPPGTAAAGNSETAAARVYAGGKCGGSGQQETTGSEACGRGDAMEVALAEAYVSLGFTEEKQKQETSRLKEFPFDSVGKSMSVIYRKNQEIFLYMKGAPEVVLGRCTKWWCGVERRTGSETAQTELTQF